MKGREGESGSPVSDKQEASPLDGGGELAIVTVSFTCPFALGSPEGDDEPRGKMKDQIREPTLFPSSKDQNVYRRLVCCYGEESEDTLLSRR